MAGNKEIEELKQGRTNALSALTKKRNELSKYMTDIDNLHLAKSGLNEYNSLFNIYQDAHSVFYVSLDSDEDRDKEMI